MSIFLPIHPTFQTMAHATFVLLHVWKQKPVGRRFLMDTLSVNICHFIAYDFLPHHSTRRHVRRSRESWNCIAKREQYFEGMWKCHMIITAFMFSSPAVIRNDALLVRDCSGCLYYRTERQVCNLILLFSFFLSFFNHAISMSNEHLFLLKCAEYRPTPNWRDVISQPSMK